MKHVIILSAAVAAVACLYAVPTANEDFVIAEDAQTFTNAVNAAKAYADMATNAAVNAANAYADARADEIAAHSATTKVVRLYSGGGSRFISGDGSVYSQRAEERWHVEFMGETYDLEPNFGLSPNYWEGYIDGRWGYLAYDWNDDGCWALNIGRGNDFTAEGVASDSSVTFTIGTFEIRCTRYSEGIGFNYETRLAYTNDLDFSRSNATLVATIRATAPAPGNYAAVSNAAMNAAQNATNYTDALRNDLDFGEFKPWRSINADYSDEATALRPDSGIVRDADDIIAQLDAATTTNSQQSTQLTTLAGQVATIGAHLNAEDARFVVTNYNSVTHTPEAYVEIQLPDESWSRIWSEMTRWNYLFNEYLPMNYYDKAAVNAALADKADRAWGFYDSTTGAYAPDGYTWISSEKIAIAANLAYQRTVTAEGAIWVLESNGVVTETGGMTNGFFRISDDEGNSLFEIVKGNKRTVGADASSCQVVAGFSPTKLQVGYSIVSDVHPTLYVCQSLATQNWKAETDSDCIANVTWSGTSGAYVAQVQGKSAYSSMFVKATYEVGGETYISNAAPVSMQYIMIGGVKYAVGVGTVSGTTVLTLTVAQ